MFQSDKFRRLRDGFALPGVLYRKKNISGTVPARDSRPDVVPAKRERGLLRAKIHGMSTQGAGHLPCRSQAMWRLVHVLRGIAQLLHLGFKFNPRNEAGLWPAAGNVLDRLQQIVVNAVDET